MSSAYQTIIARLRKQMQTIPAPPVEQSDYKLWTRSFLKTLVSRCSALQNQCSSIIKVAYDRLAKGETDPAVVEMVDEAVHTIEAIMDDTWVSWAGRSVPNIARRVREEAEAKDREEKERKIRKEAKAKERLVREEAERVVRAEAERVVRREKRQQEKLDLFLNESITAEEFERDLEVDGEAERSKVTGVDAIKNVVIGQVSEMEINNVGEDKVEGRTKMSPVFPSQTIEETSTHVDSGRVEVIGRRSRFN